MPEKEIRFLDATGKVQRRPAKSMLQQLGVGSVIRIRNSEFPASAEPGQELWHINLPIEDGGMGERVLLAEIVENGKATPDVDEPPVLSFEHAFLAETVYYLSEAPQAMFSPEWIDATIGLQSVSEIPTVLVDRYGPVRGLSLSEAKTSPIAIRRFKIKIFLGNAALNALE